MPSLIQPSNLVSFIWQNVPKEANIDALQVDACFKIANFPLAKASHMASVGIRKETLSLDGRGKLQSFLESFLFLLLAIIHIPSTCKLYSLHPKIQHSHPGLEPRINWCSSNPDTTSLHPGKPICLSLWVH